MFSGLQRCVVAVLLVLTLFSSVGVGEALASFGITPPYVRNTSLTRGATYEQQILLVRGDADVAQKAEVTIDAPEIESWIQVLEGDNISLPRGEQKVPMTVRITVPKDAEFKDYEGAIRIRTLPEDGQVAAGAVSISLGALVDVDLSVIDKKIKDFRVRKISAGDLNEGKQLLWLLFPGKIRFDMTIENTGNVDIAPSDVEFRMFDRAGKVLYETEHNLGKIDTVAPYDVQTVTAAIPTRLPAGSYVARYKIYNGDDVKQEGDISINILPAGTLQLAGFGFLGLSLAHKISVLLPVFFVLITGLYLYGARRRRRRF
ncbi:hypothetical protein KC887_00100 [Candidatus Kaiserbacteria bacterium]|nr:hypothetical protein [Candidatus Kaiserbacteria bacterium]